MKGFVVFHKQVAAKLMLAGEELLFVRRDKKEPTKKVYVFQGSKTIQRNIRHITQN